MDFVLFKALKTLTDHSECLPCPFSSTVKTSNGGCCDTLQVDTIASACLGDIKTYTIINSEQGITYSWTAQNGIIQSSNVGNVISVLWTNVGTGILEITPTNQCGDGLMQSFNVSINDYSQVSYDEQNDTLADSQQPVVLTGGTPSGGVYSGLGVNNGVFDPSVAGIGSHIIEYGFTQNGCTSYAYDTIIVYSWVGAKNIIIDNELKIYPNPNSGQFTIDLGNDNGLKQTQIIIYTITGQIVNNVSKRLDNKGISTINTSLPTGSYLIKVIIDESLYNGIINITN